MKILAVIPARGGSKGIPKKNIRLMNGKPLIAYIINTARKSKHITDVFVSTDNKEISDIAQENGANVIYRGESLSGDMVTLDPVVFHAKIEAEERCKYKYDLVITLQPTSPLLTLETLDKGIDYFIKQKADTVISVVNKPHLAWGREDDRVIPLYKERKNRQELPAQLLETGAFVIAKSECVLENSRIGKNVSVFEIPEKESIDIDDKNDWILAESLLKRRKIIFRVDGYIELGMGHIYNCITLAYSMIEHDVLLVTRENAKEGIVKIKESNLPYCMIKDNGDLEKIIKEFKPDVFVNDCLNTEAEYILNLKKKVSRVVTIEDLGTGINEADAVINALYDEVEESNKHIYSGYKYVCLRDEFQLEKPTEFSPEVKNILIMFGGTDPSNLNKALYQIILKFSSKYQNIKFEFITGIGYDNEKNGVVTNKDKNIFVYPNVHRVAKYMKTADLAITSHGRTVFELAAMGVPAIVLSQNSRETTHRFAQMEHGFLNLGMGTEVNQDVIENTLDWLIRTAAIRKNMHELMLKCPLRSGLKRVKNIILGDSDE